MSIDNQYFIDDCRKAVANILSASLGISSDVALQGVDLSKRDFHFTVAVPRFRIKAKPQELTQKIEQYMADNPDPLIEPAVVDGPFAHFVIRHSVLLRSVLSQVFRLTRSTPDHPHGTYGSNSSGEGRKIIIEFSSPNIAKPFHAGHLRSTIIGAFLSNLYTQNGWQVTRMNYLGDWGVQYGILAVGFKRYGSEEELAKDPIMHLFQVYVKASAATKESGETLEEAQAIFKAMEDGDPETLALWQRFRDLSIEAYKDLYSRLNVAFDDYSGESMVTNDNINSVVDELRSKGLLVAKHKWESQTNRDYSQDETRAPEEDKNPAWAVDLNAFKLGKPVVQKPDGTTIYMVRDIAGAIQRYEKYKFDKMIYVVGDQQDLHCAQFFKILDLMGKPFASSLEHVNFGRVKGMSTRKGEVEFLSEILDTAKESMLAQMQKNEGKMNNVQNPDATSDQIGMTCVKIQDMQSKRLTSYPFDWNRMTSFEGDTGAYLQYAHARLCSVERNVEVSLGNNPDEIDTELLKEPKAKEIAYLLAIYPEVVKTALKVSEPSTIASYCFKLSHLISSAWDILIVKGQEKHLAEARLLLFVCARSVLASGMHLLTLTPLQSM